MYLNLNKAFRNSVVFFVIGIKNIYNKDLKFITHFKVIDNSLIYLTSKIHFEIMTVI